MPGKDSPPAESFEGELVHGMEPDTRLPFGVSRPYAALARSGDPLSDPIAAQYVPTEKELVVLPYESTDPIGDTRYLVTDRLVHHYPDRALLLVSDRCATYCRFCFRRHFTGHGGGRISDEQLEDACAYLSGTPSVREILLSGGDPLMLSDKDLETVLGRVKHVDPDYIIRICTRMPVVLPSRVTDDLARMLGRFGSVWVVVHANHPRELTDEFRSAIRLLSAFDWSSSIRAAARDQRRCGRSRRALPRPGAVRGETLLPLPGRPRLRDGALPSAADTRNRADAGAPIEDFGARASDLRGGPAGRRESARRIGAPPRRGGCLRAPRRGRSRVPLSKGRLVRAPDDDGRLAFISGTLRPGGARGRGQVRELGSHVRG